MLPALSFLADKVCIFVAKLKLSGKISSGGTSRDRQVKISCPVFGEPGRACQLSTAGAESLLNIESQWKGP